MTKLPSEELHAELREAKRALFTDPDDPWSETWQARAHRLSMELGTALHEGTLDDRPLPEDSLIRDAHPTHSGNHQRYAEAMRMVGAKRSKYALVDLVNWLLSRIP